MSLKVIVTRNFDHMSEVAAVMTVREICRVLSRRRRCVLGLATGNTPTGLYKHLAKAANEGKFDTSLIRSFNLDEYIGLPGDDAQQRALHPESYCFFMVREFFGLLRRSFGETSVPGGNLIQQDRLEKDLASGGGWQLQGTDKGKAVVISPSASSEYLRWIRRDILDAYRDKIENWGGVDLQIVGVGGRGHVGFHEAGIPFSGNEMLLVRLDDNTVHNAVTDGHFTSVEESPRYAVSMGAELIYRAGTVFLMASGERKTGPVAESLLMKPDCSIPISYGQTASEEGRRVIYILDLPAAAAVLREEKAIKKKGIEIEDISKEEATLKLRDLCFCRDPETGLLS